MTNDIEALAQGFAEALASGASYRPPSADAELDVATAYLVQDRFNRLRAAPEVAGRNADAVCGYKAGISVPAAQRALGLVEPATGFLFASGQHASGSTLRMNQYRGPVIETELAFQSAARLAHVPASLEELRAAMATVSPVLEIAAPGFGGAPLRGTDLIATNLACGGFVTGVARAAADIDINAVALEFMRDADVLHTARATDLGGDHWSALYWLVSRIIGRGQAIEPGQWLLTGALGPAQPARPGHYVGDYGALGQVTVTFVD